MAAFILNNEAAMRFSGLLVMLILPFYFFSCTPQQRLPGYLENLSDTGGKRAITVPPLRIQKFDIISIEIHSASLDPQRSDAIYNQIPIGSATGTTTANVAGYLVDENGNIEHHRPELGVFHAEGLTKQELANEIKKKLTVPTELLTNPTVVIRFLNFKVSVSGAVNNPGTIEVPDERITIFQAINKSGDISDYGVRQRVKVIRELNGEREIGFIDLSTDKAFESPYYYLAQNDQIIVDESEKKAKKEEQQVVQQKMTMAFTIATVVTSITQLILNSRPR